MAFQSFVAVSVLVLAVLAQPNPLVPSGISTACSNYLESLDNNTSFMGCLNPFTSALSPFNPSSAANHSCASVTSALNSLCSKDAFNACPQSTITTQLTSFYTACSSELTSANSNKAVKTLYDMLYVLVPLRQAICTKDDGGNYCATKLSSAGSPSLTSSQNYIYTSVPSNSSNSTAALVPNTTTYQNTNLVFLFLSSSESSTALCTSCTRNIMEPFITFESSITYAPGLSHSVLLGGQSSLYTDITTQCGQSFLSGAVEAAGGLSKGYMSGAAPLAVGQELSTAVGAILGVAAFVAASL